MVHEQFENGSNGRWESSFVFVPWTVEVIQLPQLSQLIGHSANELIPLKLQILEIAELPQRLRDLTCELVLLKVHFPL